ncbi:MAG: RNA methyltransferase [Actinomycetaceae bacterium]|nr:RNA methyltransferase [Actinomycetaceae bacterium]
MIIELSDLSDSRLRDYMHMTDVALRSKSEPELGLFMAESKNVIIRAIDAGFRPRSFLMAPKWVDSMREILERFGPDGGDVPVFVASEDVLRTLTGFHLHRGALASMFRRPLPQANDILHTARRVAVLEDIVDHTNVGAIFRSAAALGIDGVLVTPSCADPLFRRSVRVSMGTVFQVPWTRLEQWPASELFASYGFHTAALALTPEALTLDEFEYTLADSSMKIAWILGAEGYGLKDRTVASADTSVIIPMKGGVDSLNVASAAAVAFWASRVRNDPPAT